MVMKLRTKFPSPNVAKQSYELHSDKCQSHHEDYTQD